MLSFDFSRDNIHDFVQQWFDAPDQELDSSKKHELYEKTEFVAKVLENKEKTFTTEHIQNVANALLEEFDNHKVGESHRLAEWVAENSSKKAGAYKPLHHLFKALAKIHGNRNALKADRTDITGTLASLEHIDSAASTRIKEYLLKQDELQSKIEEAQLLASPDRYQHLNVYGNKHKHNVMQKDLAETLKVPGVKVPLSHGIETDQVINFLKITAPDIFKLWDLLKDLYAENKENKANFFEIQEVKVIRSLINSNIIKAFEKADSTTFEQLGISNETLAWISDIKERGNFLILRSSGAEDTRTSANAGGNESVPYVIPTPEDYIKEIGTVIKSYFSEASLRNRINAGQNPFEEPLKLSLTMNEMIGEEVGGSKNPFDIPISLVSFTNEPFYVGKDDYRVMRISACYGNGNGVVGQEGIATDTVLILQNSYEPQKLHVVYDNQYKPERLGPVLDPKTKKIKLGKIANTKEMAERPVLTAEHIKRLFQWGVIGEKFFDNHPTDMEIVIKRNIIQPVQARPIIRPELLPTYLDLKKIKALPSSPISEDLKAEMIVPGQASVIEITKSEEVLIDETLAGAEALYKAEDNKLVIVGQPEGANTHPVVNFSTLGTPCLYARGKNYEKVQEIVEEIDEKQHLAVCMQAGTISLWNTDECPIEECSSKGFVVHPAKVAISFPAKGEVTRKSGATPEIPQEIKDLLLEVRTATTSDVALKQLINLQNHGWLKDYQDRVANLKIAKKENPLLKRNIKPIIAAARSVEAKVNEAFTTIAGILNQKEPARMELLLNVKILETALFQEPVEGAIGHYSVLNMHGSFEAANAMIAYQKHLSYPAHFADVLMDGSQCPSEEVFNDWSNFLLKLEPLAQKELIVKEDIQKFKTTLITLREAGVLPLFMTFFLPEHINKEPIEAIQSIGNLVLPTDTPLLEKLHESQNTMKQLKKDISAFSDPKSYQAAFKKLQDTLAFFLSSEQPWLQKEQWEKMSPCIRSIAIQNMNELVSLYDSAVKAMKLTPSNLLNDVEKTIAFKKMLVPYLQLLRSWSEVTLGADTFRLSNKAYEIKNYLDKLESILNILPDDDPKHLYPSSGFSITSSILGSSTGFLLLPKHLEDVFTVIHQGLLSCTSIMTKNMVSYKQIYASKLPEKIKHSIARAKSIIGSRKTHDIHFGGWVGSPQLIGIDVTPTKILFNFNVPLRTHSAIFALSYDKGSESIGFKGSFFGANEEGRWELIKDWATVLDAGNQLPLMSRPRAAPMEASFTWDISKIKNVDFPFTEYDAMAEATLVLVTFINGERQGVHILGNLTKSVVSDGYLLQASRALSKNSSESLLRERIYTAYVGNLISHPEIEQIQQKELSRIIWGSSHELLTSILNVMIKITKGDSLENALINIPQKHASIVKQQIEYYMKEKDMRVLHQLLKNGALMHRDLYVEAPFLELWKMLIKNDIGIQEIWKTIRFCETQDIKSYILSLDLRNLLAQNGHFENSFTAAKQALNFKKGTSFEIDKIRDNAFSIIRCLIDNDQNIPKIISFIHELNSDTDKRIRPYGISLFTRIYKRDPVQFHDAAVTAATNGMLDEAPLARGEALELWKLLVKANELDKAVECILKGLESDDHSVQESAILLSYYISSSKIGKNFGKTYISKIADHARKGLLNVDTVYTYVKLWKELDRDIGTSEGVAAAREGIQHENFKVRFNCFDLLINFIKTKNVSENDLSVILEAAQIGVKDSDKNVTRYCLLLWEALKPLLKSNPSVKVALDKTLEDWQYWQYGVPTQITDYYKDYLQTLTDLNNIMK